MNIESLKTDEGITIKASGRVDTNTSPQLQTAVLSAFQSSGSVTIDCQGLVYISSAGLRVFLIAQKTATSKGGSFVLTNVSPEVLSILDLVGFSSILTIK